MNNTQSIDANSPEASPIDIRGQKTVTLKVGDTFYYAMIEHDSVGIFPEYGIADTSVIRSLDQKFEYLNPENLKPGLTGGDKARVTFIFKAVNTGETTISFQEWYRRDLESEDVVTVRVISDK